MYNIIYLGLNLKIANSEKEPYLKKYTIDENFTNIFVLKISFFLILSE